MGDYDPIGNPYADVPERMRDLGVWLPSVEVVRRGLAGHEMFGLQDQPMTPRHKVFIALAYAYADGRVTIAAEPYPGVSDE